MKRIFTFGLMLAGAFAMTNCAEELIDPTTMPEETTQETVTPENEGIPFKVYATLDNSTETKTEGVKDNEGHLKTNWVADDQITAFYEDDKNTLNGPITLTVSDIETGEFSGFTSTELKGTYNWYFVYGGTNKFNGNLAEVNIDGTQTQSEENAPTHIGGSNCPMWGKAEKISGSVVPRVQMKHLATLHEITIKNTNANADGGIIVTDLGMIVSSAGTWISKHGGTQQPLTGLFDVDILTGKITAQTANKNYEVKLKLSTPSPISNNNGTKTFYVVTAPLTIQTESETDPDFYQLISDPNIVVDKATYNGYSDADKALYQQAVSRQDVFTFKVNGSARTVPADRTYNMKSGSVYRFTLPVHEMTHPLASDAFDLESAATAGTQQTYKTGIFNKQEHTDNTHKTRNILSITDADKRTINASVNGTTRGDIYVLDGPDQTITIEGFAKDLFNALPVGFYASRYKSDMPTAMTIKRLNIWIPEYNNGSYNSLKIRKPLTHAAGTFLGALMGFLEIDGNGVSRSALTRFVDPNTITFNNIVPNGDFSSGNAIVMTETDTHKDMSIPLVNNFLSKFAETDDNNEYKVASFYGLYAILNATLKSDGSLSYKAYKNTDLNVDYSADDMANFADQTARAIYWKLYRTFESVLASMAGGMFAGSEDSLLSIAFTSAEDLKYKVRDMKFLIEVQPYPYASYYIKDQDLTTGYTPIVLWGMDFGGIATDYN